MDNRSLSHTRWKCQYHIVFIPKYRKKVLYGKVREDVREMNDFGKSKEDITWDMIRLALSSVADLAIIPIQDYLCLGAEARINHPSTLGFNWKWRLRKGQLTDWTLQRMHDLTRMYGRLS